MSEQISKANVLDYLKEHYLEFKSKYHVEKIGLFGGYARDEAKEGSDIDIFVKMKPSLFDMVAIKEQIENESKRFDLWLTNYPDNKRYPKLKV